MKKIILILSLSFIGISQSFAGAETDKYCENGPFGLSQYTGNTLFQVNYGQEKKSISEALYISVGQRGVSAGVNSLFYNIIGENSFEIYKYNCNTHTPTKISSINQNSSSEKLWIATYNDCYIVFATTTPGMAARTQMESIYIYDIFNQKMIIKIPTIRTSQGNNNYDFAENIYRTKKGNFILMLVGDDEKLVRKTSMIEINSKTGKITEL